LRALQDELRFERLIAIPPADDRTRIQLIALSENLVRVSGQRIA
jgi:hypothetical protein